MRPIRCSTLFTLMIMILLVPSPLRSQLRSGLDGMWQGTLLVQGMKLRLVFHLTPIANGYRATMDSPDQGAKGIPTDSVIFRGDSLQILMRRIGGQFAGVVQAGDTVLDGTWSQSGAVFPMSLVKTKVGVTYRRPQSPLPPFPYTEEEVSFEHRSAGFTIAGTLTKPSGAGPFAAAVLITGSGAQDRDETIFEHKPFRLIADQLTRSGIAVLRCDDRGKGSTGGTFAGATSADFATDIASAVEYLRRRQDIRPDRIGLIGHSEGGVIAPMLAARRPDIAFIVLLAGPSISGVEIIVQQDSLISLANGVPPNDVARKVLERREMFEISRRETDTAAARKAMEIFLLEKAKANDVAGRPEAIVATEAHQMAVRMSSPWMRFFLYYDPMEALRKVRCPILALNGEKDLQVPWESNLRGIEQAGAEAKNADVTVKMMPGLNHLFQTATTGSPMEYATIEETMSPAVLRLMTDWIVTTTR